MVFPRLPLLEYLALCGKGLLHALSLLPEEHVLPCDSLSTLPASLVLPGEHIEVFIQHFVFFSEFIVLIL